MFLSITDMSLRPKVSTTTAMTTTTVEPNTHACIFQDSATCALTDQTVCSQVRAGVCEKLPTTPYPLYVKIDQLEDNGKVVFNTSVHLDAECTHALMGAIDYKTALAPDTCTTIAASPKVWAFNCLCIAL